jgi:excisionase family DNA binding protein
MQLMNDLLTTRQLQELLQIDRTTVYRMLKDGRLKGVKVGNQWRFPRRAVAALLSDRPGGPSEEVESGTAATPTPIPYDCIQTIQNVFAEVAEVGAMTITPDGEPLTAISHSCPFCDLILGSKAGRRGCIASWRKLARQPEHQPKFCTCHAGLQYARARIELDGRVQGMLIAGQFYATPPQPTEEEGRIEQLAERYGLDRAELRKTAQALPVLAPRKLNRIGTWLESVAGTFAQIGHERADLLGRLQHIAEVSTLSNQL